ncbi:MAG TPA: hypothetical protein VF819_10625 [Nitrospira sp.]
MKQAIKNDNARPPTRKELVIQEGRKVLRTWLEAAELHGKIYYKIESVSRSGMNRRISLSTIIIGSDGKPEIEKLWPTLPEGRGTSTFVDDLDIVAKDWGFSFNSRTFNVGGCGMDMVFWLVDNLAYKAGIPAKPSKGPRSESYANRVKREQA